MFDQITKIGLHVETAELPEGEALGADCRFVDIREGFEQFSSPVIDMFEGDHTPQGVDHRLDKENALLWVREVMVEHFDGSDVSFQFVIQE